MRKIQNAAIGALTDAANTQVPSDRENLSSRVGALEQTNSTLEIRVKTVKKNLPKILHYETQVSETVVELNQLVEKVKLLKNQTRSTNQ